MEWRDELKEFVAVVRHAHEIQSSTSNYTTLPSRFIVPSCLPWPLQLQNRVIPINKYRKMYKADMLPLDVINQLYDLNFVWDLTEHQWQLRLQALTIFKSIYNHLNVSYDYITPSNSPWPIDLQNIKLGIVVTNLRSRHKRLSESRRMELNGLGFIWDSQELVFQTKLQALHAYHAIHGHIQVPFEYIIPSNRPPFPTNCWGMKLGRAVHDLRCRAASLSTERKQLLDDLGFVWDSHEYNWETKLMALAEYKREYGNVHVPQEFCIPNQDPWPKETWGLKLGQAVTNIRSRSLSFPYERRQQLDQLGFVWDYPEFRHEAKMLLDFTSTSKRRRVDKENPPFLNQL
ncbi:hypothetical protein THRCLA_06188 [Thraustotheca clavata]|uniref:Helicase-associated domain-containing protein n=1 Tax=Thraustotheca clavata TaxID=74557 RepID=A0A1V9ZQC2_9STRA|nr:hypothetical protein THRCLA_06188 [Thraustotheca clavata]